MKTLLLLTLTCICLQGMAQTKKDTTSRVDSIWYVQTPQWQNMSFVSKDTVNTITYCVNIHTLKTKWLRLRALTGLDYGYVSFNGLMIYNKYLNVPKGYKAVYSITK